MTDHADPNHIHSRACDRDAVVRYQIPPMRMICTWRIAAWCTDTEATVREHVKRHRPRWRVLTVTIAPRNQEG